MQQVIPGQANTVQCDVVSKTTADPIVSGTAEAFLLCTAGENTGKWWDGSDWSETEVSCGEMSYAGGACWQIEIAADAWVYGAAYSLYAKESGGLNLVYTEYISTWSSPAVGRGGHAWTYTVTDSTTGVPLAECEVWACTDSAGSNIVARDHTDELGQATFYLTPGVYYVFRRKSGYAFTNPDIEVVTE